MVFTITNPHLLLAVYNEIFSLCSSSTRKPIYLDLRVAKRIEKTDKGFSQNKFCCIYKTNISSCEAKKSTSPSDHNTNKSLTSKTLKQKMSG